MSTYPVAPFTAAYGFDRDEPPAKAQRRCDPVYLMLRPYACLGAIFGQLPLCGLLNRSGPTAFRWCSLLEFYTLFVHATSAANVIYLFNTVYTVMTSEMKNGSDLDSMMVTVYMYITIIVSGLSNLIVHLKAKEIFKLYRLLQHIEKQLALAARPYDLDSLPWKRKLLSPILILFMWLSSILTIFVLKFAAQPGLSFVSFVISVINVNFATGFPFLHVAALCWATHLLYGRLSCVMERVTGRYTFEDEVDEELDRTSRITMIQVVKQAERSTLAEIEHIRRIQQLIFSFSRRVSEAYTPAFLIITPCFFLNCAFFMYQAWGILASGEDTTSAALNAVYALNCIAPAGLVGWAVDKLRSQHEKMVELVHCCRTEVLTNSTANALQFLALQLLQSNPQVSVADFFSVDRRFLLAMFGNLVTYLVILIQFR